MAEIYRKLSLPYFYRANALDNEHGKSIIYIVGTSKNSINGNLGISKNSINGNL